MARFCHLNNPCLWTTLKPIVLKLWPLRSLKEDKACRYILYALLFFAQYSTNCSTTPRNINISLIKFNFFRTCSKGRCQKKKNGKMGEFWKNRGGGLPESHFHFLLFFTWETPQQKVLKCKINHHFFSQTCHSQTGGRGGPHLGKIPTFSRFFFFGNVPFYRSERN